MAEAGRANGAATAPPSASRRGYLRSGLPGVYSDMVTGTAGGPFAMRFVLGLEEVLDPIVTTMDMLSAHFDTRLAPAEIVTLVADWLGVELDDGLPTEARRRLVRAAMEINRGRGTRAAIELVLALAFDGLEFEVSDGGCATCSEELRRRPADEPTLTVVGPRLDGSERLAIRRLVEELTPAHVRLALEERASR